LHAAITNVAVERFRAAVRGAEHNTPTATRNPARLQRVTCVRRDALTTAACPLPEDSACRDAKASGRQAAQSRRDASHGAMRSQEVIMLRLYTSLQSLTRREEGQDLLEYALLVALIAIVAVAAVTAAGLKVETIFNTIVDKLPG